MKSRDTSIAGDGQDAGPRVGAQGELARGSRESPLRVVFAGHDLRFARSIIERLDALPGIEVRCDEWQGHAAHVPSESRALADWADLVVAEWCLGNAVWYSRNLPANTSLIVRLHRVELETSYLDELDADNIDRIVAVSPCFADKVAKRLPSIVDRVVFIPNAVDCDLLNRPKLSGSEFRVGLLGGAPRRKRLDLALDIFERLKRRDRRYLLSIKGKLPTEHKWVWEDAEERRYFLEQMARINHSPWRDSVVFEPFGPDTAVWFRKIGFILSPSDDESFHLSVAEGMASGAIPVIRLRDEVPGLYPDEFTFRDVREAVDLIERLRADDRGLEAASRAVQTHARQNFDLDVVLTLWEDLIRRVADEARHQMAPPRTPTR